jgi:hypothetical protein
MKIANVHDSLGSGRKRKAGGYEYLRSNWRNVEGQLHDETRVKVKEAQSERTRRAVDAYEGGGTRA